MFRHGLLAVLTAATVVAPAAAQNADTIEKEAQKPSQVQAQQTAAETAAEKSKQTAAAQSPDVDYSEVLAHPDDLDLNFRYALTQVRRGELKGASATLERILLVKPDLEKVRLMYALVLLRLDNLSESERELTVVVTETSSQDLKKEGEGYLAEVKRRQKRTQISGRLGAGFEYDDNRNSAPSTGRAILGGTEFQLAPGSMRRDDTSMLFLGNVEAHHDLGTAAGHEIFGSINYFRAEQTLVKNLNLAAYSFAGGGVYKTPYFSVTPQILFDHVELAQTTFMRDYGADVRVEKQFTRRADLWFDLRDVRQNYSPTVVVPLAADRTGIQVDSTLGADYNLSGTQRVGGTLLYGIKHAGNQAFSFDRRGLGLSDTWLLGRGTFLLSSLGFNVDHYWRPDTTISAGWRRDTTWRLGATYGAPLSVFTPKLKDLLFTLTYEYLQTTSTIENYAYTNNKIAGLLTYKWSAGF